MQSSAFSKEIPMPNPNEAPRIYATFRYSNAPAMIDWLCDAFGFTVQARYGDGDVVHHAQLTFGSSMIMLGSVRDDAHGKRVGAPAPGGRSTYVAVDDTDAMFERARAAGARIIEEPVDRDYGSRDFVCADPEGYI